MRIVSVLAVAAALQALVVQGRQAQASPFGMTALESAQDTTVPTTPAPVTTTTATTTTATTTTSANDTTEATPASDDTAFTIPEDGGDDDLIGLLRPDEVVDQLPGMVLLADGTTAKAAFPWTFKKRLASVSQQQFAAPHGLELMAMTAYGATTPPTTVPCTNANNLPNKGKFKVLVAVSTCFDAASWKYIKSWIEQLERQDARYFDGDATSKMDVDIRTVDDGCDRPSWAPKLIKEDDKEDYVAAINILVYTSGCKTLQKIIAAKKIQSVIGFVYNGPGPVLKGVVSQITTTLPGYTVAPYLDETNGFLGPFDPFGAMRKIHCTSLPGGVPNSYLQKGQRKCFCSCPVGTELKHGACQPTTKPTDPGYDDEDCTCAWLTKADGYRLSSLYTPSGVCQFKSLAIKGTTGLLPVPVVVDNYVDRYRTNLGDGAIPLGATPKIELSKSRTAVKITDGPNKGMEAASTADAQLIPSTWQSFQASSSALVDKLEFGRVGRFDVQLKATDYGSEDAKCNACVLVIDDFRPAANPAFPCPKGASAVPAQLTKDSIKAIQKLVTGVSDFKANALNDPCGTNARCDEDAQRCKKFVEKEYSAPIKTIDNSFFDPTAVKADLLERLRGDVFDAKQTDGINKETLPVCERCVKASTILKEWWADYKCGAGDATAKCEGSASCAIEQCVQVDGTKLATATAALKASVKASSLAVVKAKGDNSKLSDTELQTKFELGSSVHIALDCVKFPTATEPKDPKCTYSAVVKDLVEISTGLALSSSALADALLTAAEVNSIVAWRYRVDGVTWRPFDTATAETFDKTETTIAVEAWTRCGIVKKFTFKVVLHLNNKIEVCEKFPDMWYQATRETPKLPVNLDLLCMHPKSDFAEVTFDYHPNIGLPTGSFEMTISKVVCTMKYESSPATGNATVINVGGTTPPPSSYEIVKEFSIDGASVGMTKPETTVHATCTFTYRRVLDSTTTSQVCNRKFVIKDCTPPKITKPCPTDGKCDNNKCAAATDPKIDLYQACGGNRVSQATDLMTTITTDEGQCCASCDTKFFVTQCLPLRDTPSSATSDSLFIKRCEPVSTTPTVAPPTSSTGGAYGSYGSYGSYSAYSVLEAAVSDLKETATGTASALLGATAMVAVVALVVVRRRQSQPMAVEEDAYYPLMG